MTLELILGIAAIAAVLFAIVCQSRMRTALADFKRVQNGQQDQEGKLATLRQEIGSLKDDIARKNRALDEARESARKKFRKDAQKSEVGSTDSLETDSEVQRLQKALKAMEAQVHSVKNESVQATETTKVQIEEEYKRELQDLKNQVKSLKTELSQRGDAKKKAARMAGVMANLETLPPDVVTEFARIARKAEQHEKLHALAQGKFQLAQERFSELQKRYFAVCRELALAVGRDASINDVEARESAEQLVEAVDQQIQPDKEKSLPVSGVDL